jgi:hypothetical protein
MIDRPVSRSMRARYRGEFSPQFYQGSFWYLLRREYFLKSLSREAKKKYRYTLDVLGKKRPDDLPENVAHGLRHYSALHGRIQSLENLVFGPLAMSFGLAGFIACIVASISLANRENIPEPVIGILSAFVADVAIGCTCLYALPGRAKAPSFLLSPVFMTVAALSLEGSLNRHPWLAVIGETAKGRNVREGAYFLFTASAYLIVMIVFTTVLTLTDAMIMGRHRRRYAYVVLLNLLVQARRALMEPGARMSDPSFKTYLSGIFERAAVKAEGNLGQSMALRNPGLQAEVQAYMRRVAAKLRAMQLQLALSDNDTMDTIRDEVTQFIYALAAGNYALLPAVDPGLVPARTRKAAAVVRDLAIAVTPLAALTTSRYLGLAVTPGIWNWAVVFSVAWASVTVIAILDPLYKSKIADIRDIISIIRNNGQ